MEERMEVIAHTFSQTFSQFENSSLLKEGESSRYEKEISVLNRHSSLLDLVLEWIEDEKRSVWLGAAVDDTGEEVVGVSVVLQVEQNWLHGVYLTYDEIRAAYPKLPSVRDYASIKRDPDRGRPVYISIDDEKMDKALGFSTDDLFDFELYAPMLTPDQALRYALVYAISGTGEASLYRVTKRDQELSDYDDESYRTAELYHLHLGYRWSEKEGGVIPALGNSMYFRK
jgi:hypothetical protein